MSASKNAARPRKLLAERVLPPSNRSERISSKHGGHSARNRRRHGVGANRLHHHLQIERFLANAQIIIEQSEADCANWRHQDTPDKVAHLHENRPENQELSLLGVDGHEEDEWKLKHGNDAPDHRKVKQVDHKRAPGKISGKVETPPDGIGGADVLKQRGRRCHADAAHQIDSRDYQRDETGNQNEPAQNHYAENYRGLSANAAERLANRYRVTGVNLGYRENGCADRK